MTIESDRRAPGAPDPRLATARPEPTRPGPAGHEPADPLADGPPDPLTLLVAVTESIDEGVFAADRRAGSDGLDPRPGGAGPADGATADGPPDGEHLLVRVLATDLRPDSPVDLQVLPVDGHPLEHLTGMVAPDSWWAVGVVAYGRARALAPDEPWPLTTFGSAAPTRLARTTHLVSRAGDAAWVVRLDGDDPVVECQAVADYDRSLGAVDDTLRRVLGLPSAPPPAGTAELWASCWLDAVRQALHAGTLDGADWSAVARRHPLFDAVDDADDVARWAIERLDRAGRRYTHHWSWTRVLADRRSRAEQLAADARRAGGSDPTDATDDDREVASWRWIDEGLLARQVLATLEPAGAILDQISPGLDPTVTARIRRTLRAWPGC